MPINLDKYFFTIFTFQDVSDTWQIIAVNRHLVNRFYYISFLKANNCCRTTLIYKSYDYLPFVIYNFYPTLVFAI